ncbi:hypothetical protein BGW80DRAFT_1341118 [Lactifluus volemus]|nr:hypothetical protein BGW80DRAFT_1341118 [Lactifluus volemus]
MAASDDRHTAPDPLPIAPFVPSAEEAKHRYYGLPSQPYFVARSSHDVWVVPTVWEGRVGVAMHTFLVEQKVRYTSVDPVRIGIVNESAAPVIIWVGVEPGSLSAERGIEVAVGLRAFLLENGIEDVHVEIPCPHSNPTVKVREAFSTALGITICAEKTPHIQGTATLFFTVSSKPEKLFLLAAKHVLFCVDEENEHYEYNSSGPRRNVLLLGTNGFDARIKDIEKEIGDTQLVINHFRGRLELAGKMEDPEEAQAEREDVQPQLVKAERAILQLEQFLADVKRDWDSEDPTKHIIGHVVLLPLISAPVRTASLPVIEVDTIKIDAGNFIGNAIDLGTEIPVETLTAWMHPDHAIQPSFKYPPDRLLKFHSILSNDEMCRPNPNNVDDRGDPAIMAVKRGCTSGLTIGRLNNTRSILRKAFKAKPGEYSMEVAVLPRTSQFGAFSEGGDSGAAVINGWGAVAGMLMGGGGSSKASDCTYVTPITFLLKCLEEYGFSANIFPVAASVFV